MNNKNEKKSSTEVKFKKKLRTNVPLSTRLINNFIKLKKDQVHKTYRFWIANFVFLFFFAKSIQFVLYIKEFVVSIPREEAMKNLMLSNTQNIKNVDNNILTDYLDKLENMKKERAEHNRKEIKEKINTKDNK